MTRDKAEQAELLREKDELLRDKAKFSQLENNDRGILESKKSIRQKEKSISQKEKALQEFIANGAPSFPRLYSPTVCRSSVSFPFLQSPLGLSISPQTPAATDLVFIC